MILHERSGGVRLICPHEFSGRYVICLDLMGVSDNKCLNVRHINSYGFFKAGFLENEGRCFCIPAVDIARRIKSAEVRKVFRCDSGLNVVLTLKVPCRLDIQTMVGGICSRCISDRTDSLSRLGSLVFLVGRESCQCQLDRIGPLAVF